MSGRGRGFSSRGGGGRGGPGGRGPVMPNKQDQVLMDILKQDNEEKLLHRLSDIRTIRPWDYSLPTLTTPGRFTKRRMYSDDAAFFETLRTMNHGYPYELLEGVGALAGKNQEVLLYGGSLLDIVLFREDQVNDFDLRLIGPQFMNNEAACVARAKTFVSDIFHCLVVHNKRVGKANTREKFAIDQVMVVRRQSTVSVVVPGKMVRDEESKGYNAVSPMTFQLTFSPHKTPHDLLVGCFPQCTQLALWDNQIILTGMAKYCIESLCVVFNPQEFSTPDVGTVCEDAKEESSSIAEGPRRPLSLSVERGIKYFQDKGFDIILPHLDISKIPRRNLKFGENEVADLPTMTVIYSDVVGNKIMVSDLRIPVGVERLLESEPTAGYAGTDNADVGKAIHHNIICLVADVYDRFQFVSQGEVYSHVFDYAPQLTPRMITNSYATVMREGLTDYINVNKVLQYFSATTPEEVLNQLVIAPVRTLQQRPPGTLTDRFTVYEESLKLLVEKETIALEGKVMSMKDHMKSKGLDRLIAEYRHELSTDDQVLESLYGDYRLDNKLRLPAADDPPR